MGTELNETEKAVYGMIPVAGSDGINFTRMLLRMPVLNRSKLGMILARLMNAKLVVERMRNGKLFYFKHL